MSLSVNTIKSQDVHAQKQHYVKRKAAKRPKLISSHIASVHVVPLHMTRQNAVEVLLMRFPFSHAYWPGMWYVPGYSLDKGDDVDDKQQVFDRIFGSIVRNLAVTIPPVKTELALHYTARGKEVSHVHYAEVLGVPHVGRFFDMRELPDEVPEHYATVIKRAATAYRALYS